VPPLVGLTVQEFSSGFDATASSYLNSVGLNPPRTAFKVEAATITAAANLLTGNSAGDMSCYSNTAHWNNPGEMPGQVNGFALSTVSQRYVVVSDGGAIKTLANGDLEGGIWFTVNNPFTANINAVWYDPSDNMIIAVGSNGEIGRSVDGIS